MFSKVPRKILFIISWIICTNIFIFLVSITVCQSMLSNRLRTVEPYRIVIIIIQLSALNSFSNNLLLGLYPWSSVREVIDFMLSMDLCFLLPFLWVIFPLMLIVHFKGDEQFRKVHFFFFFFLVSHINRKFHGFLLIFLPISFWIIPRTPTIIDTVLVLKNLIFFIFYFQVFIKFYHILWLISHYPLALTYQIYVMFFFYSA